MATTRDMIKRLHKKRPNITGPEIAAELNISRQRVHSLTQKMGITLATAERKRKPRGKCKLCGRDLKYPGTETHARCHYVWLKCLGCGVRFKRLRSQRRSERGWHSPECFKKYRKRRAA